MFIMCGCKWYLIHFLYSSTKCPSIAALRRNIRTEAASSVTSCSPGLCNWRVKMKLIKPHSRMIQVSLHLCLWLEKADDYKLASASLVPACPELIQFISLKVFLPYFSSSLCCHPLACSYMQSRTKVLVHVEPAAISISSVSSLFSWGFLSFCPEGCL